MRTLERRTMRVVLRTRCRAMRSTLWRVVAVFGAAVVLPATTTCGGGETPTTPTPAAVSAFQPHVTEHFTFQFTAMDAGSVAATATLVESQYARIVTDLGSPAVSRITVFLHPNAASMQPVLQDLSGAVSGATGLVTDARTVHVLSPNLATTWPYEVGIRAIVHEFAHCVSMHVNPSIPNNPRWLWETVAVHEAGDFIDPRTVASLTDGPPPSLARLNGFDNLDIYLVGYTIGEFIVERWGRAALVELVRNNGNLAPITGLTSAQFFAEWYAFVRTRYF
jgi:hypothetical protein